MVNKEALEGYRKPTVRETQRIFDFMKKELGTELKLYRFFRGLSLIGIVVFLLGLIMRVTQNETGEVIVIVALIFVNLLLFIGMFKSVKQVNGLLEMVNRSEMLVLDCTAYKIEAATGTVNKGVAYIQNLQGVQCSDKFILHILTARQCQADSSTGLLLVKIGNNNSARYELLKGE